MAKRHYIVIEDFMLDDENLSTNEMLVYAVIYGFSMSDECAYTGRVQYIADTLHIGLKTVRRVLKSLVDKGYIEEQKSVLGGAYSQCKAYRAVERQDNSLEGRLDKLTTQTGQIDHSRLDKLTTQTGQIDHSIYKYIQEKNNDIVIQDRESKESADQLNRFNRFWDIYPKRVARKEAEKAFSKLNPDDELLKRMLSAVKNQAKSKQWCEDNGRYIPNAATWLNGKRWEDELTEATNVSKDHIKGSNYDMDAIERDAKEIVEFSL